MSTDPLDAFEGFVREVRARLEAGRATYGDRSFARPPAELIVELQHEALDLAGWGFVLWIRLEAMRAANAPFGTARLDSANRSGSKSSKATSVSDPQTAHLNTTLGRATLPGRATRAKCWFTWERADDGLGARVGSCAVTQSTVG